MSLDSDSTDAELLLSIRPLQSNSNYELSLADQISRINFQRANQGGFRTLTEESLREEIAQEEAALKDDVESDSRSSSDEEEEELDRIKELTNARQELLGQIELHEPVLLAILLLTEFQVSASVYNVCPRFHFARFV
ncbi:hypothetical protein K3495_g14603 [Podosphaera aphanis]|nr:hypothetical protein K3495_g14603 [Podosphaera aphanis]